MNDKFFASQIARLEDQWRAAYGKERTAILWRCFQHVQDGEFQEAVSECLATQRSFPLLKELEAAVGIARTRSAERRAVAAADRMLASTNLTELAEVATKESSREFARACLKLAADRKSYTPEQWKQAMNMLEKTSGELTGTCPKCMNGYTTVEEVPGYQMLYRCSCSVGRSLPPEIVGAKNGEVVLRKIPIVPYRAADQAQSPDRPQERT